MGVAIRTLVFQERTAVGATIAFHHPGTTAMKAVLLPHTRTLTHLVSPRKAAMKVGLEDMNGEMTIGVTKGGTIDGTIASEMISGATNPGTDGTMDGVITRERMPGVTIMATGTTVEQTGVEIAETIWMVEVVEHMTVVLCTQSSIGMMAEEEAGTPTTVVMKPQL